jgi:ankyrin repeat protein
VAGKKSEKPAVSLLQAVEAGDLQRLQESIKASGDVDELGEYSPLSKAAEMGRADMVDALLKAGADPNFGGLWIPMCCAVRSKDVATLKRLLETKPKVKVDAQEEEGATALMYAAAVGSLEMVKLLVAAGANPKKKDEDGETAIISGKNTPAIFEFLKPLSTKADVSYLEKEAAKPDEVTEEFLAAVKQGDVTKVKALLAKGVKLGALGKGGEAALHIAVETQNSEIIELLLAAGASVNVRNQYSRTPLFIAINRGDLALVERLIKAGADVNAKEKLEGGTPFLASVSNRKSNHDIMRLLAKHGADILAVDVYGRSALNIASRWLGRESYTEDKDREVAESLRAAFIEAGVLHPDAARLTQAAAAGDLPAVRKFIESGLPVDTVDEQERTALYMAISRWHPELVAFLLKSGADMHKPAGTDSGEDKKWGGTDRPCPKCGHIFTSLTQIWHCLQCGHQFNAREIFGEEGGGELYMTWSNGHLPLVTAARLGDPQIIGMLLDAGVDPNRGKQKITPLMYACYFGHFEAARMLIARGADAKMEGKTPDRLQRRSPLSVMRRSAGTSNW